MRQSQYQEQQRVLYVHRRTKVYAPVLHAALFLYHDLLLEGRLGSYCSCRIQPIYLLPTLWLAPLSVGSQDLTLRTQEAERSMVERTLRAPFERYLED